MSVNSSQIAVTPDTLLAAASELKKCAAEQQAMCAQFSDVERHLSSELGETSARGGVNVFTSRWSEALHRTAEGMLALAIALEEAAAAYMETERQVSGVRSA
ncbi:MAG: hypothetical protein ACP5OR_04060 [Candidatus Dormibacteria bacterium]